MAPAAVLDENFAQVIDRVDRVREIEKVSDGKMKGGMEEVTPLRAISHGPVAMAGNRSNLYKYLTSPLLKRAALGFSYPYSLSPSHICID